MEFITGKRRSISSNYTSYKSFAGKMRIAFFLLAFPFFVIVYFLVFENISLTSTIIIFFPLALFSILTGFSLLRRSSDQLVHLSIETGKVLSGINSNVVSKMTASWINLSAIR